MKKISFLISFIGIFLLLLIINLIEPGKINIKEINQDLLNKEIKIQGQITQITPLQEKFTKLKIKDNTGEIEGVCNCPNLEKRKTEIIGEISQYKNKLQIRIDKITYLN